MQAPSACTLKLAAGVLTRFWKGFARRLLWKDERKTYGCENGTGSRIGVYRSADVGGFEGNHEADLTYMMVAARVVAVLEQLLEVGTRLPAFDA